VYRDTAVNSSFTSKVKRVGQPGSLITRFQAADSRAIVSNRGMSLQRKMDKTADIGEDGIMRSSSAVTAAGAMTAARWTTAWSTGQPATSHGHQIIAECPVCLSSCFTKLDVGLHR